MKPVPMTQGQLVAHLRTMARLVEVGDSFEGSIEYSMPTIEEVPEDTYALVQGVYRIGNLEGQGGVRIIGEV